MALKVDSEWCVDKVKFFLHEKKKFSFRFITKRQNCVEWGKLYIFIFPLKDFFSSYF